MAESLTSMEWVLSATEKLGASIEDMANEMYQELLGAGDGGHKPPRPDIAKMKELYELQTKAQRGDPKLRGTPYADRPTDAQTQWQSLTVLTPEEQAAWNIYHTNGQDFESTVRAWQDPRLAEILKSAIKKNQTRLVPSLYNNIDTVLSHLKAEAPESYKLWPWVVKQLKNGVSNEAHIIDVVAEGGKILNELKNQHKTPPNFDIGQMDFDQFEEWLMQWKRDNRASESQGKVIYQFHDGWTIQLLTTPAQLQFEGDEMGHCVGGMDSEVESKKANIYSLRDPKGDPHVTMNIIGEVVASPDSQMGNWERKGPHEIDDGESLTTEDGYLGGNAKDAGKDWNKTFDVEQVMGKGNSTPKPEYQRKIKEFLDFLKEHNDIKFVRSEEWHYPVDSDEHDSYYGWGGNDKTGPQGDVEDWWQEYQTNPDKFLQDHEDAHGITVPHEKSMVDNYDVVQDGMDEVATDQANWQTQATIIYHNLRVDQEDHPQANMNMLYTVSKARSRLDQYQQGLYDPPVGWSQDPEIMKTNYDNAQKYLTYLEQLIMRHQDEPFDIHPNDSLPPYNDYSDGMIGGTFGAWHEA